MRKTLLIILIILISANSSLLAAGSFEAIINVPIGVSFGGGNTEGAAGKTGFESGINAKLGYMFIFDIWALSVLTDIGYSYDSYKVFNSDTSSESITDIYDSLYVHSFQLGVIPKFSFKAFSVGLGAGIKIPWALSHKYKRIDRFSNSSEINTSHNETLYGKNINKILQSKVIPYLKVTFEYSIYFNEKIAFNIGGYFGYDFNISKKNIIYSNPSYDTFETKINTFDMGLQIGLRFAPTLK